jgi:hypothetical protein
VIFGVFSAFIQFLVFTGIVFALKINSDIKIPILSFWAEPASASPTHLHPGPPARRSPSGLNAQQSCYVARHAAAASALVCAPRPSSRPAPIKGEPHVLVCPSSPPPPSSSNSKRHRRRVSSSLGNRSAAAALGDVVRRMPCVMPKLQIIAAGRPSQRPSGSHRTLSSCSWKNIVNPNNNRPHRV